MKQATIKRIRKFTEDRDWDQFHTPANLAKSIAIEAAELLECFQWSDTEYDLDHVKEELADVLVYCRNLLDKLGLEIPTATEEQFAILKKSVNPVRLKNHPVELTEDTIDELYHQILHAAE